jgi:hypothetical protein
MLAAAALMDKSDALMDKGELSQFGFEKFRQESPWPRLPPSK